MSKQPFSKRIKRAWRVLQGKPIPPTRRSMQRWPRPATKTAPMIWPTFREGVAQWQMVDIQAYIDEGFNQNTLIYSAILYKVRAMIAAPLRAYEGSADKPNPLPPDAPLSLLVARPNFHQSWAEFHSCNVVYLNLAGNCYIMMDRQKPDELPTSMYTLRPDRVVIVPYTDKKTKEARVGYVYVPEGRTTWGNWSIDERRAAFQNGAFVIPAKDLAHIKLPNPGDPLEGMGYGLSPIAPGARSADVDNKVAEFLKLFFERGTMTYGLLKYDIPLDDPTIADIKERWKEIYGGYKNWEDIAVLDSNASYQRMGFTFDEMGFDAIDERNESRILSPFGVPGVLIGTRLGLTKATYSNVEELRRMFWQDTMVPETSLFEAEFKYYLAQPDSDSFVAFDYSKVPALQSVRSERATQVQSAYAAGAATRNEYRASLGLPMDESKGTYYVMPLGLVEVSSGFTPKREALPAPAAEPAPAPEPAKPATTEQDEEGAAAAVDDTEQRGEEEGKARKKFLEAEPHSIQDAFRFAVEYLMSGEDKICKALITPDRTANDAMIACYVGDSLGVDDDASVDWLHMTLAYIPDTSKIDKAELIGLLELFSGSHAALSGTVNAVTVFENGDSRALVALFDSPQLPYWRNDLIGDAKIKNAIDKDHGYVPHITLDYLRPNEEKPPVYDVIGKSIRFSTITLVWNADMTRYDFSLDGTISGLPGDRKELERTVLDDTNTKWITARANTIEVGDSMTVTYHGIESAHVVESVANGAVKLKADVPQEGSLSPEAKANHWKAVDRIARSWEGKFEDGARDAFNADKRALLAILNKGKSAAYAEKRTVSWDDITTDALDYLRGPSRKQWTAKFTPLIGGLMEDQAANIERTFFGKSDDGPSARKQITAAEWFDEYILQFAQPISETTERNIAALLAQAQNEGWSIPTTMDRLGMIFQQYIDGGMDQEDFDWFVDRTPAFRRENVARTETIRSSNAASTATMREYGSRRKEWLATLDNRCRPEHLAANGQIVGIDEPFIVGGVEMQYPGDPSAPPELTCQCRCSVAPVL